MSDPIPGAAASLLLDGTIVGHTHLTGDASRTSTPPSRSASTRSRPPCASPSSAPAPSRPSSPTSSPASTGSGATAGRSRWTSPHRTSRAPRSSPAGSARTDGPEPDTAADVRRSCSAIPDRPAIAILHRAVGGGAGRAIGSVVDPREVRLDVPPPEPALRLPRRTALPLGRKDTDAPLAVDAHGRLLMLGPGGPWLLGETAHDGLWALATGIAPVRLRAPGGAPRCPAVPPTSTRPYGPHSSPCSSRTARARPAPEGCTRGRRACGIGVVAAGSPAEGRPGPRAPLSGRRSRRPRRGTGP